MTQTFCSSTFLSEGGPVVSSDTTRGMEIMFLVGLLLRKKKHQEIEVWIGTSKRNRARKRKR